MKIGKWLVLAVVLVVCVGLACSMGEATELPAAPVEKTPLEFPQATQAVLPRPLARQDGLVAHYPFTGNAEDASGNGYHGQVFGAQLATDRWERAEEAYAFDGVDDYIRLPDYLDLFDLDFTISAWMQPEEYGMLSTTSVSCQRAFFAYRYRAHKNGAPVNSGLFASLREKNGCGGDEQLGVTFIGPDFAYNGLQSPAGSKEWFLYTLTRQAELLTLYVDGQAVMEKVVSGQPVYESQVQPFTTIGAYLRLDLPGCLFPFQGGIDDVRIYQRALGAGEVVELYRQK